MKRIYLAFFIALCSLTGLAQGTIKVKKVQSANDPKDMTSIDCGGVIGGRHSLNFCVRTNYAFKGNSKVGYEVGLNYCMLGMGAVGLYGELQIASVQELFKLSSLKLVAGNPLESGIKLNTTMTWFKMPLMLGVDGSGKSGKDGSIGFGLAPSYLINARSNEDLIRTSDFHRFNCDFIADFGMYLHKINSTIGLRSSTGLLPGLKDEGVYDTAGNRIARQKSRTKLVSVYIYYHF